MDTQEPMDPQKIFNDAVRSVLAGCIDRDFVLPFTSSLYALMMRRMFTVSEAST